MIAVFAGFAFIVAILLSWFFLLFGNSGHAANCAAFAFAFALIFLIAIR